MKVVVTRAIFPEVVERLRARFEVVHNTEDRPWVGRPPEDRLAFVVGEDARTVGGQQTLDRLRVSLEQPGIVASYATSRVVFPEGEYAHPSGGTVETLQAITRDDIVAVHRKYYRPDNAVLIFSA